MHNHDHSHFIEGVYEQFKPLFDSSEQCMYIYLDDENKRCNEKFAKLLGYKSAEEWANVNASFPEVFVEEKSQNILIDAYQVAMEKGQASSIEVTWKKKGKGNIKTKVTLVPIIYDQHLMALHFISEIK